MNVSGKNNTVFRFKTKHIFLIKMKKVGAEETDLVVERGRGTGQLFQKPVPGTNIRLCL